MLLRSKWLWIPVSLFVGYRFVWPRVLSLLPANF
jgi:hypothetical protein